MIRTYHWAIAQKQWRSRRASTARLIACISLCSLLVSAGAVGFYHLRQRLTESELAMSISVFLKPGLDAMSAADVSAEIQRDPLVASIDVRTPDSARNYFNDRYGVDVGEVLPQNPFPFSLIVHPRPAALNADSFVALVQKCRSLQNVVDDVSYHTESVRLILNESQSLMWIGIIGGSVVLLTIFVLLWFALRAESSYSSDDIRVMVLLGAKNSFLSRSTLWRNLLCSIPGILIGGGACLLSVWLIAPQLLMHTMTEIIAVTSSGILLVLLLVILLNRASLPSAASH